MSDISAVMDTLEVRRRCTREDLVASLMGSGSSDPRQITKSEPHAYWTNCYALKTDGSVPTTTARQEVLLDECRAIFESSIGLARTDGQLPKSAVQPPKARKAPITYVPPVPIYIGV